MSAPGEALSEAERRFDRVRRRAGLWLGPLFFVGVLLAPSSLDPAAQRLAAVLALTMTFWISEAVPLPVTAILGPALAVLLGVAKAREGFAPFADPVIFLFLGSFLIAGALQKHGLDRRIAVRVLSVRGVAASPLRIRIALAVVAGSLSMWMSNTATAAMLLPVALGLTAALKAAGSNEPPRVLLLLVGFGASLGGIATPVGTPPNLITLGFLERLAGVSIDFLTFMLIGLPLSLALSATILLILRFAVPPPTVSASLTDFVAQERRSLPPFAGPQKACLTVFAAAVTLWVFPGVVALLRLDAADPLSRLAGAFEEAVVALVCAAALFFWPDRDRRVLSWEDGQRIDWGTLLLFGGGLALGKMMFDTQLAAVLGRAAIEATGVHSLWGLTALALGTAIVLTELTSNVAAVNMLAPLVIALTKDLGVPVLPPVLATCFGASMAFMFPISTPPNAIVYGTGLVPFAFMMRIGALLDVASFFVILAALRLLCPLLGLV